MATIQSLLDSLCRCFGSTPLNQDILDGESISLVQRSHESAGFGRYSSRYNTQYSKKLYDDDQEYIDQEGGGGADGAGSGGGGNNNPATPDMKRRTRSLKLQDKSWDALFSAEPRKGGPSVPSMKEIQRMQQQEEQLGKVLSTFNPLHEQDHTPSRKSTSTSGGADNKSDGEGSGSGAHGQKGIESMPTPKKSNSIEIGDIEQAEEVARAKLAANPPPPKRGPCSSGVAQSATRHDSHHHQQNSAGVHGVHKRKRASTGSGGLRGIASRHDDIFRSKEQYSNHGMMYGTHAAGMVMNGAVCGAMSTTHVTPNPLSRFLSKHPVIAQTLCFATPIRDSREEKEDHQLEIQSVMSGNTLNTAEDTITSTLYYETTKLAGLTQKNPPMPLWNTFQVDERDDIHQIIASHSHSSARMRDIVRDALDAVDHLHEFHHHHDITGEAVVEEEDEAATSGDETGGSTPPRSPHQRPRLEEEDPHLVVTTRTPQRQQQQHGNTRANIIDSNSSNRRRPTTPPLQGVAHVVPDGGDAVVAWQPAGEDSDAVPPPITNVSSSDSSCNRSVGQQADRGTRGRDQRHQRGGRRRSGQPQHLEEGEI